MLASSKKLNDFVAGGKSNFFIPPYQRNYDWKFVENIKPLLNDIEEFIESGKSEYFLGTIVVKQKNSIEQRYILVDGQQRITTFLLIISALRDIVKNDQRMSNDLEKALLTEDKKVKLSNINDEQNLDLILKNDFSYNIDQKSKYFEIYKLIKDYYQKLNQEKVAKIFYEGILKLEIVQILLTPNEDEFLVFESINSKGKALTPADLIKNYVLMQIFDEEKLSSLFEKTLKDTFSDNEKEIIDFYRNIVAVKTGYLAAKNGKDLYFRFKKNFESSVNPKKEVLDLIEDINIWKHVKKLKNNSNFEFFPLFNGALSNIYTIVHSIYKINVVNDENYVLDFQNEKIRPTIFYLSQYCVAKGLGKISISKNQRSYSAMANKLYMEWKKAPNKSLFEYNYNFKKYISDELENAKDNSYFPNTNEIFEKSSFWPVYELNNPIIKWILISIESSITKKDVANTEDINTEHIFPQSEILKSNKVSEKMLHTLGNLSISHKKDNSRLSNQSFNIKKRILNDFSYYKIDKILNNYTGWTDLEITDREKKIKEIIRKIWFSNNR